MPGETIRLTQYSHGSGCGCKIAPSVLDTILLASGKAAGTFPHLLVGHDERDDAAVMDLGDGTAIISTTDFFMPVVDDPETFGRIAATNAISDIYAMGGHPLLAIAILGWPLNMLAPEIAGQVVRGAQMTCQEAGIPLAGGHSIDAPEPMFGLAVTGRVAIHHMKKNGGAHEGDILFLTKPLGVGILTTAQKLWKLKPEHEHLAIGVMTRLNSIGERLGKMEGVHAMTDVTGFGLAGHLMEMCRASESSAEIRYEALPVIDPVVFEYMRDGCVPGGAQRNFESYGHAMGAMSDEQRNLVCDPQTSGGLLIAVHRDAAEEVKNILQQEGLWSEPIGQMKRMSEHRIYIP